MSSTLVRSTTDPRPRPNTFGEFGLKEGSNPIVSLKACAKGSAIYRDGDPADNVYQVKSGAVRSSKLLSDGRRQIGAFHLVDDIFGMTSDKHHRFTAEAIVDTTLWLIERQQLDIAAEAKGTLTKTLLSLTTKRLQHAENHMLLLGRKLSEERVAAFLLEMDKRLPHAAEIRLPMSRRDIADYLGLTLETVSRALSRLQRRGIVGFAGNTQREIILRDKKRLSELDQV